MPGSKRTGSCAIAPAISGVITRGWASPNTGVGRQRRRADVTEGEEAAKGVDFDALLPPIQRTILKRDAAMKPFHLALESLDVSWAIVGQPGCSMGRLIVLAVSIAACLGIPAPAVAQCRLTAVVGAAPVSRKLDGHSCRAHRLGLISAAAAVREPRLREDHATSRACHRGSREATRRS